MVSAQTKPIIEWVSIPAGSFTMGSPEREVDRSKNETQHQVTLGAYMMSKYEITFEQYDLFCDATGRKKPSDAGWGRNSHPVINVSGTMQMPLPFGWIAAYLLKPNGSMQHAPVLPLHLTLATTLLLHKQIMMVIILIIKM